MTISSKTRRLALAFIAALAAPAAVAAPSHRNTDRIAHCSWDAPGHNPFTGELPAALDRYTDIPSDVRARLQQRMQTRDYDDLVDIRRDSIAGKRQYNPAIRDMHFGRQSVCKTVSRDGWSPSARERGLVYCDTGHCILVPTVCRNVSRIAPSTDVANEPKDDAVAGGAGVPPGELAFDPPGAGLPTTEPGSFEQIAGLGGVPSAAPLPGTDSRTGIAWPPAYVPPIGGGGGGGRDRDNGVDPHPPLIPGPGPDGTVPSIPAVPEPGTAVLALLGLAWIARAVQRRAGTPN